MSEPINEELISAYIDGELSASDREVVESALAASDELSRLHAELRELGATFEACPRLAPPANFRERILKRAEAAREEPVVRASMADDGTRSMRGRRWFVPTAVLAAVAVVALAFFGIQAPQPNNSTPWADTSLVYYEPDQPPQLRLVYDVTITPRGEANGALEEVFQQCGIAFDPDLRLDAELEETILKSRILKSVQVKEDEDEVEAEDEVEMVYVVARIDALDQLWRQLLERRQDFLPPRFDMFQQQEQGVMYRVNERSRVQFASQFNREKQSLAHRLSFRVKLMSTPGMARLPSFSLETVEPVAPTIAPPIDAVEAGSADIDQHGDAAEVELSEVLFILRYPIVE